MPPSLPALQGDISPDDRWLASSKAFSNKITLWEIASGKEVRELVGMKGLPEAIQFSKDSKRVAALSSTGEIIVWERESGKELQRFKSGEISITEVLDVG